MQTIDFARTFREIQLNHAASLVKAAMAQSKNLGELSAILDHQDIGPLARQLRVADVMNAKSYDKLYSKQVRAQNVEVPQAKRAAIKKFLLKALVNGDQSTPELEAKVRRQFDGVPRKFTYVLLRELEISSLVHRKVGKCPIFWSVAVS